MDPNLLAGDVLEKRIAELEKELARLKPYEPKPLQFGVFGLAVALVVGLLAGGWIAKRIYAPRDTYGYSAEP